MGKRNLQYIFPPDWSFFGQFFFPSLIDGRHLINSVSRSVLIEKISAFSDWIAGDPLSIPIKVKSRRLMVRAEKTPADKHALICLYRNQTSGQVFHLPLFWFHLMGTGCTQPVPSPFQLRRIHIWFWLFRHAVS
ncbi:hypothetical protein B4145_0731 [Bacillus subtilis]|uniref:Uncharacterized protein n=1 Tax=Bacillus subtilis subsp. subtilis TaxID=135461 RepID=A0ABD3ZPK3_BACIU|nr:hypothetical protein B4067_0775 [Bacillus subtilis subsp. subtilis]KIN58853.1 hypothetical protein B4145_0731 [Bacillus subtilis]